MQRTLALAIGHDELRHDRLQTICCNLLNLHGERSIPLAGKSTLIRLEDCSASAKQAHRYHKNSIGIGAICRLILDLFPLSHESPPEEIVIDVDATDDPLHGHLESRSFIGNCDCYCYLPLYMFCGENLSDPMAGPGNSVLIVASPRVCNTTFVIGRWTVWVASVVLLARRVFSACRQLALCGDLCMD